MDNWSQEVERIIDRQKARLLTFIEPVNPPEIIKDAIRKYFEYAKLDIKNIDIENKKRGMGSGDNQES